MLGNTRQPYIKKHETKKNLEKPRNTLEKNIKIPKQIIKQNKQKTKLETTMKNNQNTYKYGRSQALHIFRYAL